MSSDPTELIIMELVGSQDTVLLGRRAVVLGGLGDGDLYTRVPSMFMQDPIFINRQQVAMMAKPSEALIRMHHRFWDWWGSNTAQNERSLDRFMAKTNTRSSPEQTDDSSVGSRTIH